MNYPNTLECYIKIGWTDWKDLHITLQLFGPICKLRRNSDVNNAPEFYFCTSVDKIIQFPRISLFYKQQKVSFLYNSFLNYCIGEESINRIRLFQQLDGNKNNVYKFQHCFAESSIPIHITFMAKFTLLSVYCLKF